ncbi:MAG: sulfatase-like hydrolase/transferase, partial [Acidimicrobiia bacterium]|nr:sulfatase-like hydrolase/transferase [Acidimicrobiia bacterium]
EDLSKPAAQAAYRAAYASGYGPPAVITACYDDHAEAYRRTYYRCHAENDDPIGRVRRAVTAGSADAVIVRTADHGELLGAHGGLHQKWFNLYDECTRVPFQIVRVRDGRPVGDPGTEIDAVATSHVDVLPTLLGFAGIDAAVAAAELTATHSEVHLLPGHDLRDIVAGGSDARAERTVYLMSRDNILEGDTGLSAVARINGMTEAPDDFRIMVPADVGSSFEAIVTTLDGTLWKLARNHDDPATWTDPGRRHLASTGADGHRHRTEPIADQWELYDLSGDPVEADNRWDDPEVATTQAELVSRLDAERARCNPARNTPWPYASRRGADEVA